jgi:hypothetical protein
MSLSLSLGGKPIIAVLQRMQRDPNVGLLTQKNRKKQAVHTPI